MMAIRRVKKQLWPALAITLLVLLLFSGTGLAQIGGAPLTQVFHTNGQLWNRYDNEGNIGGNDCAGVEPSDWYPGFPLNYICRAGLWIVARINPADPIFLEGQAGFYTNNDITRGSATQGWANPNDPYADEPWVSVTTFAPRNGIHVTARHYSWSYPGVTDNYFKVGDPLVDFDFNDFIIEDYTLVYTGDLDGSDLGDPNPQPDPGAPEVLDQVIIGFKNDSDMGWNLNGFIENFWEDDLVDYDETSVAGSEPIGISMELDDDRPGGENDFGIDDGGREYRAVRIGHSYVFAPKVNPREVFPEESAAPDMLMLPLTHYWWTGENDPQTARKRWLYASAIFNAEDETKAEDPFQFDPNMSGDLKQTNPPAPTDMRYLHAYGPYRMALGDTIRIVVANVAGHELEGIKAAARAAKLAFMWNYNLPKPPPAPEVAVSVTPEAKARVVWDATPEGKRDPDLDREDFAGYRIYRASSFPAEESGKILQEEGLPVPPNISVSKPFLANSAGPYRMIKEIPKSALADIRSGNDPEVRFVDGKYEFIDTDVIINFNYWYYVAAYDEGDPSITSWQGVALPNGLPSLQSYRTRSYPENILPDGTRIPVSPPTVTIKPQPLAEINESSVRAQPNPWRPDRLRASQLSDDPSQTPITFIGLTGQDIIRIFDVAGNLVRTVINDDGDGSADWNLLSDSRLPVASGVYFYRVDALDGAGNETGTPAFGKLMVIR